MRIQHNIAALNSYRNLTANNSAVSKNLEKLSSGYRINRAGDDAAGLAISEKMRAQITGLDTAQSNAQDGISLVQTAEGNLQEVHSMLNRMVELATQSANGTYDGDVDRANLQKEVASLNSEINRISESANFNGIKLLDGSIGEATGVGIGKADAVAGTAVDSAGAINAGTTTAGVLVKGQDAIAERGSFYMPDEIQVSYDAVNGAAGTATFTLTLGNGEGNTGTVQVTLTGANVAGSVDKFKMEDIVNVINGDAAAGGGIAVTYTDADNVLDTAAKVKDKFKIDFTDNKLNVESTTAGTGWSVVMGAVASTGVDGTGVDDIQAMTQSLRNDLTGAGAPANIALGAVTEQARVGENAIAGRYTVASTQVTLNAAGALHGQALKVGDKTYIMKDRATDLDPALQALYDDDTTGDIEIVEFDPNATAVTSPNSVASTALTNAINANKGTTHIQATVAGNTLTLSETESYGNAILAAGDESMITDMATATGASDLAVGAFGERTKIGIDADLENGSQVTIGGHTYQFLSDPADAVDGKVGIQFTDGNQNANAQALLDAIKAKDPAMAGATMDADGHTILLADDTEATASSKGLTLQVGETSDSYQKVSVVVKSTSTTSLGIDGIDIGTQEGAAAAIDKVKAAINSVSSTRGDLGAIQNRLEHTINNLSVTNENMTAAESRIRDVDMAKEMMTYTKNNILVQASQAMLAQANQVPQGVLQLLQ